jgi:hypothetical protein
LPAGYAYDATGRIVYVGGVNGSPSTQAPAAINVNQNAGGYGAGAAINVNQNAGGFEAGVGINGNTNAGGQKR